MSFKVLLGGDMLSVIYILVVLAVEFIAPSYVGILIAIGNCFFPDSVPYIDEILGFGAVALRASL